MPRNEYKGLTQKEIAERLETTDDSIRRRLELVRKVATPGDVLLIWARYETTVQRTIKRLEALLDRCEQGEHHSAAVGALKLRLDIEDRLIDRAMKLGLVEVLNQGPLTTGGGEVTKNPFLLQIIQMTSMGYDFDNMTEEQTLAALAKIEAENEAIRTRPPPPSLLAE